MLGNWKKLEIIPCASKIDHSAWSHYLSISYRSFIPFSSWPSTTANKTLFLSSKISSAAWTKCGLIIWRQRMHHGVYQKSRTCFLELTISSQSSSYRKFLHFQIIPIPLPVQLPVQKWFQVKEPILNFNNILSAVIICPSGDFISIIIGFCFSSFCLWISSKSQECVHVMMSTEFIFLFALIERINCWIWLDTELIRIKFVIWIVTIAIVNCELGSFIFVS